MFLLASSSVVVARPRDRVFRYAADLAHFAEWFPGVVAVRPRDDAPFASLGKVYDEELALPFGRKRAVVIRVMDVDPGRRLVTEGALPVLLPRMEIDFADVGSGACRLHWRMSSRNDTALARWTALPLARRTMQARADVAMARLRKRLESAP